ncbi:hypothetical protein VTJ83DRAFT_5997 [Remersonia thermophila]|uniref:SGNH hydrolase-type esterase domain-containing protein n=1 Tax=Remersonia thermophila TaxID=72144 RepID=A0ABR4D8K3_9PEZI
MAAAAAAAAPPRRRLRILCFGDSLTAGYSGWGAVYHPYSEKLEQMLTMAFPDLDVSTVEDGVPGDTVRLGFRGRMLKQFPEPKAKTPPRPTATATTTTTTTTTGTTPNANAQAVRSHGTNGVKRANGANGANGVNGTSGTKRANESGRKQPSDASASDPDEEDNNKDDTNPYDWAIVLGGTNDISRGFSPADIFDALKKVWDVPLSRGCKVLALTVPEAGLHGKLRDEVDAERNRLNALIRGYRREGFHVYDLHRHVTYFSMPEADRRRFWDDHVHFTPAGYDLIGNKVGIALVSLLARQRGLEPQRPQQKRRRLFKDDDKRWDEEGEDPRAIDKGYVVVRYVDLE